MSGPAKHFTYARVARACAAIALASAIAGATSAPAATGGSVVGATVPGATSITNQCTAAAAREFGNVTVGSNVVTATGAGVCRFGFGSSNDTARLRIAQRDRTGTAMASRQSSFTSSRAADATHLSISMASATVTYAGMNDGTILRTNDDGSTWTPETSGTGQRIVSISAIDADNAYAVANCGLVPCQIIRKRTTAGGSTWASQTAPGTGYVLMDVAHDPLDPDNAIAVGTSGQIIRTTDGGATWTTAPSGTAQMLTSVQFATTTLAYVAGAAGTLLRSTDAGATWSAVAGGPATVEGIAIAPGPTLFLTSGNRWYRVTNPAAVTPTFEDMGVPNPACSYTDIVAPAAATVLLGSSYSCGYQRTTDALAPVPTITKLNPDAVGGVVAISARSATHAMTAYGSGEIDRTTNGTSWTTVRSQTSRILALGHADDQHAFAVGGSGKAWYTSDGGSSWVARDVGGSYDLRGVLMLSATEAWVAGSAGKLHHTTDAGQSWTLHATTTSNDLYAIVRTLDDRLLVSGAGGYIARSSDGITWTQSTWPGGGSEIRTLSVDPGDGRVWLGGTKVATSDDHGRTFQNVVDPAEGSVTGDVVAEGPGRALQITSSTLWRTTDSGATWTPVRTGLVYASDVAATGNVIAISSLTGIHHSVDSGATFTLLSGAGRGMLDMLDATRIRWGTEPGDIRQLTPGTSIPDYAGGAWAGGASAFGACLQAVGGGASALWAVDDGGTAGLCQPSDADDWSAVPASPADIARTTVVGASGTVDLVWGLRTATAQPPGRYLASVELTVVAPG